MEMSEAKDLITDENVVRTYHENKCVCFVLKNGFTVKLDPNKTKVPVKGGGAALQGG
jgi:hypothetical protein